MASVGGVEVPLAEVWGTSAPPLERGESKGDSMGCIEG